MDAVKALKVGSGAMEVVRVGAPSRPKGEEKSTGEHERPVVADEVSLSARSEHRFAIRQDVTAKMQETRPEARGEGEPTRSRMPEDESRIRELQQKDFEVRARENMSIANGSVASLPTFEYDIGPDGRPYAVDGGTRLEAPKEPIGGSEAAAAPPALAPEMDTRVKREATAAAVSSEPAAPSLVTPSDAELEAKADANASAAFAREPATPERPDATTHDEAAADPARAAVVEGQRRVLDKSARAYQEAATRAETPGGFDPGLGTFESVG